MYAGIIRPLSIVSNQTAPYPLKIDNRRLTNIKQIAVIPRHFNSPVPWTRIVVTGW